MSVIDDIARIIDPSIWDGDWSGTDQQAIDRINERLKYKRSEARYRATQILARLTQVSDWKEQFIQDEIDGWRALGIPVEIEQTVRDKYR